MPTAEQLLLAEAVLRHRPWLWPSVTRPEVACLLAPPKRRISTGYCEKGAGPEPRTVRNPRSLWNGTLDVLSKPSKAALTDQASAWLKAENVD